MQKAGKKKILYFYLIKILCPLLLYDH